MSSSDLVGCNAAKASTFALRVDDALTRNENAMPQGCRKFATGNDPQASVRSGHIIDPDHTRGASFLRKFQTKNPRGFDHRVNLPCRPQSPDSMPER